MLEKHPHHSYIPANATKLVIGTFPPVIRHYEFYYPNAENNFWRLLAPLANSKELTYANTEAVEQRKQILDILSCGITDMIECCERKDGNALDNNLVVKEYRNIIKLLEDNPTIVTIFLTSTSGTNSAQSLLYRYLWENKIPYSILSKEKPELRSFKIDAREIKTYGLYSPSPTAKRGGVTDEKLRAHYNMLLM